MHFHSFDFTLDPDLDSSQEFTTEASFSLGINEEDASRGALRIKLEVFNSTKQVQFHCTAVRLLRVEEGSLESFAPDDENLKPIASNLFNRARAMITATTLQMGWSEPFFAPGLDDLNGSEHSSPDESRNLGE